MTELFISNKEQSMNNYHYWIERCAGAVTGAVLVAPALAGWVYRGPPSWMEIVVALIGIAALVLAVQDFLRRRQLRRSAANDQVRTQTVFGLVQHLLDAQAVPAVGKIAFDDVPRRRAQELDAHRLEHRDQARRWVGIAGEYDAHDPALAAGLVAQNHFRVHRDDVGRHGIRGDDLCAVEQAP
jgi:hypothetical protein